jgi:hypothetical protein
MPHPNQPVAVRHPEVEGVMVALDPAVDYDAKDALVQAYPHFFKAIEDPDRIIESVSVEAASAEPGAKRTRTRTRAK